MNVETRFKKLSDTITELEKLVRNLAVGPYKKESTGWRIAKAVSVFAAIAVAVINLFQWNEANENFRKEQRAWVGVASSMEVLGADENEDPDHIAPNRRFATNFGFSSTNLVITNSGKTRTGLSTSEARSHIRTFSRAGLTMKPDSASCESLENMGL